MRKIYARYAWRKPGGRMWRWRDGETKLVELATQRVERFHHAWMKIPDFAQYDGEPGAWRKVHAGFGSGGRGTAADNRGRRHGPTFIARYATLKVSKDANFCNETPLLQRS